MGELDEKKLCPLNIGKLTLWAHLKHLFCRDFVISSYCREQECAWWDKEYKKCAIKGTFDIAYLLELKEGNNV